MTILNATTAAARVRTPLIVDFPRLDDPACADYPAELWFTDEAEGKGRDGRGRESTTGKSKRLANMRKAIAVCNSCPALAACDTYTWQHPTQTKFGIWAGKTARQRGYDHRGQRDRRRVTA